MAGKISLAINILLTIAVIYLFTQLDSKDSTPEPKASPVQHVGTKAKDGYPSIAYVNNDSLSLNYQFRIDKSKILEKASLDVQAIENRIAKAQEDYYEIMGKSQNAGFANDEEMFAAEKRIEQLTTDLPGYQRQMETKLKRLTKLEGEINDSLYARLYRYVDAYTANKPIDVIMLFSKGINGLYANGKLDVTKEIVDGLNTEYEADQSNSKE